MARMDERRRNSRLCFVYLFIVYYLCIDFSVLLCSGFNYDSNTESILCTAQCEALCLDQVKDCENICGGDRHWMTNCNKPNCSGTCSVLFDRYNNGMDLLMQVPTLSIKQASATSLELSWNQGPATLMATIYVVQETRHHPIVSFTSIKFIAWVKGTKYLVPVKEMCSQTSYRVMAINQVGSRGFSSPVSLTMTPAQVENIHFAGTGVYYYRGHPPQSFPELMAILEWNPPTDWKSDDVLSYNWDYNIKRNCSEIERDSLPIFEHMNGTGTDNKILIRISANSIGCIFTLQVRAESKCRVLGPWTDFTIDLTNTNTINGFVNNSNAPFNPPATVRNVKLNVTQTSSPFTVNLHIMWQPPKDLGSQGVIKNYVIRSGKAERHHFPLPPSYHGKPAIRNASANIREMIFQLKTDTLPYTYGVQVVAVAPGQVIPDNQWGMFAVNIIVVDRNSSINSLQNEGVVLLNSDGVLIVHVNNTLDVQFMWDMPQSRMSNISTGDLALQWGPYVGPYLNMVPENTVIVPGNQTSFRATLQVPMNTTLYGLKIKSLADTDEDLEGLNWDSEEIYNFSLPDTCTPTTEPNQEDHSEKVKTAVPVSPSYLVPLCITLPLALLVVIIIVVVRITHQRWSLKHLEGRLQEQEDEDEDDPHHYYVMRSQRHESNDPELDLIPTVVPDRWELPHSCLKIGRVLGTGAFGQVVKGRVSKSLMRHRGIEVEGAVNKTGTHVTVAIKMLQEYTEERYKLDFLNEINMMKDIGYHKNIVSILGCCTLREPYCLVVEHIPYGDLLTHLRKIRSIIRERETVSGPYVNQEAALVNPIDLLSFARQVAIAMEYLSQKGFVHRDLAARNILVGNNKTVKVGDFGLTRYIYHDMNKVYVNRRGGKLPLKWMSIEAIFEMTFSTASDVWAFGVLIFEIVSLGGSPYPLVSNVDLLRELQRGYRIERPDNCSQEVYDLMLWCWKEHPCDRPNFTQLRFALEDLISDTSGLEYLDFKVDSGRDYYQINSDEMEMGDLDLGTGDLALETGDLALETGDLDLKTGDLDHHSNIGDDDPHVKRGLQLDEMNKDVNNDASSDKGVCKVPGPVTMRNPGMDEDRVEAVEELQTGQRMTTEEERSFGDASEVESQVDTEEEYDDGECRSANESRPRRRLSVHTDAYDFMSADGQVEQTTDVEADRNSRSSDDVFSDCEECAVFVSSQFLDPIITNSPNTTRCNKCGRLDIPLTRFDLHKSDRTDSAFSSQSSEDLISDTVNHLSETSEFSNEYLMPESPESDRKIPIDKMSKLENQECKTLRANKKLPRDTVYDIKTLGMEMEKPYYCSNQLKQAIGFHRRIQSLDSLGLTEGEMDSPEVRDCTPYITSESLWRFRKFHSEPHLLACNDEEEEEEEWTTYL